MKINININLNGSYLSYATQQAATDDVSIGKVIEQALAMYRLYRSGKIGIVHPYEDISKLYQEEIEETVSGSARESEALSDNQIQEG